MNQSDQPHRSGIAGRLDPAGQPEPPTRPTGPAAPGAVSPRKPVRVDDSEGWVIVDVLRMDAPGAPGAPGEPRRRAA